ncbi:MAG: cytidylate kinase family protein [Desulfohalobiaceae bacterium]
MAIITISRGSFSGGTQLADHIAQKLSCTHISREMLVNIAQEKGVSLKKLSRALEEKPTLLESMTDRVHYLTYIQQALARAVQKEENVVYDGLAGHLLFKGVPNLLRVKVIADMEYRIEAVMERMGYTKREEAFNFIRNVDAKREKWTRALYQCDWKDPFLYDLTINLEQMSIAGASEIVCHTANLEEFKRTPEMQKKIDDFTLCTDARAAIASDFRIQDSGIDVEAHDGKILLTGTVENLEQGAMVKELIGNIPGVEAVNSQMQTRTAPLDPFKRKRA